MAEARARRGDDESELDFHELSKLHAAYGQDHDDELCTDVILAEVRLDLIGDLVDALER